jgi:hypothetical protein
VASTTIARIQAARSIRLQIAVTFGIAKELALFRERRVGLTRATTWHGAISFEIAITFRITKELILVAERCVRFTTSTKTIHDSISCNVCVEVY